jgi:hypothetical protein
MVKIWIVLYAAGKLMATWGPIESFDTIEQCKYVMKENNSTLVRGSGIKYTCVMNDEAPDLDSPL